jgi:hypothetical protein
MRLRLAAIALILTALPASAAFLERHAHWTVAAASQSACAAFNRPLEEFNAAPYAALSIRQRRGQPARLQVFAWPGAFKPGDKVTIRIAIGPGTELAAQAANTYFVETAGGLQDALVSEMSAVGLVSFKITGLATVLFFDMSQLEAIMKSLAACMRQLPG